MSVKPYIVPAVLLIAFIVLISVQIDAVQPQTIPEIVESVRTAVVHIEKVGQWQGSGFIATEDGLIVTARHVVEGGGTFVVTLDDGTQYITNKSLASTDYDVGFLKLNVAERLPVVGLSDKPVQAGEMVLVMGSPFGKDHFNSVTMGIVSSTLRNFDSDMTSGWGWAILFQSDSPAFPGNSGGPVFNMEGSVVGILVGGSAETLNYSVPVLMFIDYIDIVLHLFEEQMFTAAYKANDDMYIIGYGVYPCH